MAQPIIIDNYSRQLRAQAAAAPWEIAGQVTRDITGGIEQLLFHAQQVKAEEQQRKLALMGTMVSKYGFKPLGPDFAVEWEQRTGMKFPRDAAGNPDVPQTDEERIKAAVMPQVMNAIQKDPQQAMVYAGLAKPPISAEEQAIKQRELDIKEQTNQVRARSASLRYAAALAKTSKDDLPSGVIFNPDTKEPEWVGFEKPSLSNKQLAGMSVMTKAALTKLSVQEKQANIDLLRHKMATGNSLDKLAPSMISALPRLKGTTAGRTLEAFLQTIADTHGIVTPPEKAKWYQFWKDAAPTTGSLGQKTSVAGPGNPITKTAVPTSPLSGKSDQEVEALLKQQLDEGMRPEDIIQQTGNDVRVLPILQRLSPAPIQGWPGAQ